MSSDELETFDQQCPFEVVLVSPSVLPSALPSALPKAEGNDSGAKAKAPSKAVSLSHGLLFSRSR